jgi:hypothetical protein
VVWDSWRRKNVRCVVAATSDDMCPVEVDCMVGFMSFLERDTY